MSNKRELSNAKVIQAGVLVPSCIDQFKLFGSIIFGKLTEKLCHLLAFITEGSLTKYGGSISKIYNSMLII